MIRNWAAVFVNCRSDRLRGGGGALDSSYLGLGFWRIYIAQTSYQACSWLIQMYRWFLLSFPSQSLCGVVVYCLSPPWHFLCAGASVTSNSITMYMKKSFKVFSYNTSSFDDESEFSSILWEKSSWAALCALGIAVEEPFFAPGNGFWEAVILWGTKEGTSWLNEYSKKNPPPSSHYLVQFASPGSFFQKNSRELRNWEIENLLRESTGTIRAPDDVLCAKSGS